MFTSNSNHNHSQSHGYGYLSSIYRMKEEHDLLSSRGITPYIMPIKVLMVACLAIEEYINLAGFRIDSNWTEFDHEKENIKDRIVQIHRVVGKPVSFDTGIWKDVLSLFEMEKLIKEDSLGLIRFHKEEIPEVIQNAVQRYPIQLSLAIAERAIELMLNYSSVTFPIQRVLSLV